ncbi:hypothetical protein EMCRGX_G011666 [Ephydatia muelleri]
MDYLETIVPPESLVFTVSSTETVHTAVVCKKAVVLLVAYLVFVTDARPYLRVYEPQLRDDEEIIEMNEDSEDMIVNSMKTDDMANQLSINAMLNTIITNQIKASIKDAAVSTNDVECKFYLIMAFLHCHFEQYSHQ